MLDVLINEYKKFEADHNPALEKSKRAKHKYEQLLTDAEKELSHQSFFKRIFPSDKSREIKELNTVIAEETARLSKLVLTDNTKRQTLFQEYVNQLIYASEENKLSYQKINDRTHASNELYNIIHKTVKAGNTALHEIQEAIDAVDSAEDMENMDLFTSSKAISYMSHSQAMSAKEETSEAVDAINSFKSQLELTKLKIQHLDFDEDWIGFDFMVDMFSSGGFIDAFSSFMALESLGKTKTQLGDAMVKVSTVLKPIEQNFAEIKSQKKYEEDVLSNFMLNFQTQARLELKSHGIEIESFGNYEEKQLNSSAALAKTRKIK